MRNGNSFPSRFLIQLFFSNTPHIAFKFFSAVFYNARKENAVFAAISLCLCKPLCCGYNFVSILIDVVDRGDFVVVLLFRFIDERYTLVILGIEI